VTAPESDRGNAFAVGPGTRPEMHAALVSAIRSVGGALVPIERAEVLIWDDPGAAEVFGDYLAGGPGVRWVQLPWAGIEAFLPHLDHEHIWTSGKDVYSRPVAEWIVAALLTAFRDFHEFARARSWPPQSGHNLLGSSLTVLGAGGITRALLELLEPWGCHVTVVRRSSEPLAGAEATLSTDRLHEAVADADAVVVALALTDDTRGIVDAGVLDAMRPDAWLVNVARGGHVVSPDLVEALRSGSIAGAFLDVTDPEPLPDDHPLWALDNCVITPHVGNTPRMGLPLLAHRVATNARNWIDGRPLVGVVDVDTGY